MINSLDIVNISLMLFLGLLTLGALVAMGIGGVYFFGIWSRAKTRHKKSLETTLLEISLPRDNEIKIDAAEQLFSSFASLKAPKGMLAFTKVGDSITFDQVLLVMDGDEVKVGTPTVDGVKVKATIEAVGRTTKVTGSKFKNKTRYTRTLGHRQSFTQVKITAIA